MTNDTSAKTFNDDTSEAATEVATPAMDAWTMITSIALGIEHTLRAAQAERKAIEAAHPGKFNAPGLSTNAQLTEVLHNARRHLTPQLHQIARASGLPLPKGLL